MYDSYFGFSQSPFSTAVNGSLPVSASHEAALAQLQQTLANGGGPLLLSGPDGVGKTTLLRHWLATLERQGHAVFYWQAPIALTELLADLLDNLGAPFEPGAWLQQWQALEDYLLASAAKDGKVVLVVDEAQHLDEETFARLTALAHLEQNHQQPVRVIFAVQPSFDKRLQQAPELRALARQWHGHCRLEPLMDTEVPVYIATQLQAAGYTGDSLFEPEALQKLIAFAHGLPGRINAICHQALNLAYLQSAERIGAAQIREVGAAAGPTHTPSAPPPKTPQRPPPASTRQMKRFEPPPPRMRPPPPPTHRQNRVINFILLIPLTLVSVALVLRYVDLPWDLGPLKRLLEPAELTAPERPGDATPRAPEPGTALVETAIPTPQPTTDPAQNEPTAEKETAAGEQTFEKALADSEQALTDLEQALNEFEKTLDAWENDNGAAETTAVPAPAATEELVTQERIQALLATAKEHMAARRYTYPAESNALDSYKTVLTLDPGNAEALQGVQQIKANFLEWAEQAQAQGDWKGVQLHLEAASIIDPQDTALRARLEAVRQRSDLQ